MTIRPTVTAMPHFAGQRKLSLKSALAAGALMLAAPAAAKAQETPKGELAAFLPAPAIEEVISQLAVPDCREHGGLLTGPLREVHGRNAQDLAVDVYECKKADGQDLSYPEQVPPEAREKIGPLKRLLYLFPKAARGQHPAHEVLNSGPVQSL